MKPVLIRNKNAILESLKAGSDIEKVMVAENVAADSLTKSIIAQAESRKIPIETVPRQRMPRGRSGKSREAIAGVLTLPDLWTLRNLISQLESNNEVPFFLFITRLEYASNLGLVARTAYAAGVNGFIFQGDMDRTVNEETIHYSMGALIRVPLVKMGIFQALKELSNYNIKTYALTMEGAPYYKQDL
ncbi:MAG: hypothetical protein KKA79_07535, partial [Nanoarchaeota archaeon]|nr:hypothetical protein [Nanoarchaeota archaeon]